MAVFSPSPEALAEVEREAQQYGPYRRSGLSELLVVVHISR
jgi:hypothetical protein